MKDLLSNQRSFQALWRNRFQVWQRLEENGQIAMKVVPSQIEFTLPSPKLGIESLPIIDPPWIPKTRTKISTIHESGQVSFATALLPRSSFLNLSIGNWNFFLLSFLDALVSYQKSQEAAGRSCPKCHPCRGRKEEERARKLSHHLRARPCQGCARA